MKQFWKKGISSFLVLVMMMSLFVGMPQTVFAATPEGFDSGTGTSGDPWIITTPEQLALVRTYLGNANKDTYFKLGADIDLQSYLSSSGAGYNSGKGWVPIGDANNYFEGHVDGDFHTISNLYINDQATDYVGLFGCTMSNATISNLMLENVNIVGGSHVGGLVGDSDCNYESSTYNPTVITNCGTTGTVSGSSNVGGLAGDNYGTIQYSYSACTVSGTNAWSTEMGGLVGKNWGDKGVIDNCYAVGSVSGYDDVGGLVGYNKSGEDYDGTVNQSYAAGKVTIDPDATEYGGLIGSKSTNAICTDSYYDEDTTGMKDSGKGMGQSIGRMKREAGSTRDPFGGFISTNPWDFTTIWKNDMGISYPYFQWQTRGRTDYAQPLVTGGQTSATVSSATLAFLTDENCTAYYVVLPSGATAPTEAQVMAGQDAAGTGLASNLKGSLSLNVLNPPTPTPITITGLQAVTKYDVYLVFKDLVGNISYYPITALTAYDKTYTVDTIAGTGTASATMPTLPGKATTKAIGSPEGIAFDSAGNMYIADSNLNAIYKVDKSGTMSLFAGSANGTAGYTGDGGPATAATLDSPYGITFDTAGNLYIADTNNKVIRKIDTSGIISTAVTGSFNYPDAVTFDSTGNMYIADVKNTRGNVYKVAAGGSISDIGIFAQPRSLAADVNGNIYVACAEDASVHKIDSNGTVTTVAGSGNAAYTGDGGPAIDAEFICPSGVAVDSSGNLYISDQGAGVIRVIDVRNGNIYTIAGTGTYGYTGDGGPALEAMIYTSYAAGLALDSHGNIYFTDENNSVVRKLAPVVAVPITISADKTTVLKNESVTFTTNAPNHTRVALFLDGIFLRYLPLTLDNSGQWTVPWNDFNDPSKDHIAKWRLYDALYDGNNLPAAPTNGDVFAAEKEITFKKYTESSSGGSSGGSSGDNSGGSSSTPANTGVVVLVNGTSYNVGTASQGTRGGQTLTTIAANETQLRAKMDEKGAGATVTIPVSTKTDIVIGELSGQIIKDMATKQDTLEIRTDNASYFLPASELKADAIAAQLGSNVKLSDIKFQAEIAKSAADTVKIVENSAQKGNFSIVISPKDFTVTATYGGKKVDIDKFNVYVKRLVAIPDGVDPNKITTGVITEPDGTSRHVPTQVTMIDGKYYAEINSLTNSTYTVVWHPMEFTDVANHWAKSVVNDMGSRMVVSGVGNGLYEPDRDITRAEFAAIVVRALGLKPGEGSNNFIDVESGKWYCDYIKTATAYNIIAGYGNGKFGPNDKITRQDAMTMISRAMAITGLKANLSNGDAQKLLAGFTDGSSASSYAIETIAACVKTGVVSGRGNNLVAPKDFITRAEVAAIVSRLLQKSDLIN